MADSNDRYDIAKIIVLSGWSLALLTMISIIGVAVYMFIQEKPVDPTLKEWAMLCLAFIVSTFATPLVKDLWTRLVG